MVGVIDYLNALDESSRRTYDQFHAVYKCQQPVRASPQLEAILAAIQNKELVESQEKKFLWWTWKEYKVTTQGNQVLQAERDWVKEMDTRATQIAYGSFEPHVQCRYLLSKTILDGSLDSVPLRFFTTTTTLGDAVEKFIQQSPMRHTYNIVLRPATRTATGGMVSQGDAAHGYCHGHGYAHGHGHDMGHGGDYGYGGMGHGCGHGDCGGEGGP